MHFSKAIKHFILYFSILKHNVLYRASNKLVTQV